VAACLTAQDVDEERHARFFDRVAAEVAGVTGLTAVERRAALRPLLPPDLADLLDNRLPDADPALATGLYHLVLEGVVLSAGQLALLESLDRLDGALPGLRAGLDLVMRDERWHLGFGVRCLQDLAPGPEAAGRLLAEGERVAGAWADVVGAHVVDRVASLHRRRLRAAGLLAR
jgi:ribonucleoside-diphosphate reductase beta chain